jgi:hypothetical protein
MWTTLVPEQSTRKMFHFIGLKPSGNYNTNVGGDQTSKITNEQGAITSQETKASSPLIKSHSQHPQKHSNFNQLSPKSKL